MKRLILITFITCVYALPTLAQSLYSIKGVTVDTASKAKLTATITVLNAKDSILRKFTHAANDGSFTITGLPAGRFLLLVTYPDYADYATVFILNPVNKEHNFGDIKMSATPHMLNEVKIKSSVTAIKIKGDTIEYNAKAYVVQPNDKVEDMLRQLPGVQVDEAGHITAQGVRVQKVLLDGEEFFGDDPTLVTRNIRGDMVDKIQIYDKKSDQAAFTGVDDGVKIKTINVILKEDKRVGTFGKVSGGAGTDDYYEGQGIANSFTPNYKAAVYGTASNDGTIGLGFADNSRIGVTNSFGGGADQLDNATYNGIGLPKAQTAGVHYDSKWNKNSESMNANYKEGDLSNTTDQNSNTLTTLPAGTQLENKFQHSYQDLFRQKLDGSYQKTYSPTSNLKIDFGAGERHTENMTSSADSVEDENGAILTKGNISDHSKGEEKIQNAHLIYNKRFKSKRSISIDLNENYNQSSANRNYYSSYYTAFTNSTAVTDQYKPSTASSLGLGSNLILTQPITPKFALVLNYGFSLSDNISDMRSYNQSSPGVYNVLDSINSTKYKVDRIANQLGAMFTYRSSSKTFIFFGNRGSAVNLKQINEYTGGVFKRNFVQWDPEIDYQHQFSQSKSLVFDYTGHNPQPSISQLQPVINNTNPLYIITGNPNLRPSFQNNFELNYRSIQQLTGQSFFMSGNFTFTTHAITTNEATNYNTGVTTTQYINLDDKTEYNYNFNVNEGFIVKPWDLRVGPYFFTTGNANYLEVNNVLEKTTNQIYSLSVNLLKAKLKKYTLSASIGPVYTFNNVIGDSTIRYKTIGFSTSERALFYLPGKFQVSSDVRYTYAGPTAGLPATYKTMWNGAISKTFLKGDNLKLSLSGNNLLDQDQNTRVPIGNRLTQTSYNTIRRYFMFSISWDFTKFGTIPVKK